MVECLATFEKVVDDICFRFGAFNVVFLAQISELADRKFVELSLRVNRDS